MIRRRPGAWTSYGIILLTLAAGNIIGANSYQQGGWTSVIVGAVITAFFGLLVIAIGIVRR